MQWALPQPNHAVAKVTNAVNRFEDIRFEGIFDAVSNAVANLQEPQAQAECID